MIPTLPFYILKIGGNTKDFGIIIGVFTIASMILRPLVGLLLDRFGRKKVLLTGLILMVIISVCYNIATSVILLLFLRLVQGMSYGISTTATGTIVTDILPKKRLGEGMGYFGLSSSLSMAIAPIVGLWLMGEWGFPVLFQSMIVMAILALCISLMVRNRYDLTNHNRINIRRILTELIEKKALPASLTIFFISTVFGAVNSYIALYAKEIGISQVGAFFTVNALAMIIFRPLAGVWSDRHGKKIILLGLLSMGISMALVASTKMFVLFLLAAVFFGIGFGFCQPSLQALAVRNVLPQRRGAANGTFFTGFDLGIGLGVIIWGGVAAYVGYQKMYLLTIISLILSGLIIWILYPKKADSAYAKMLS